MDNTDDILLCGTARTDCGAAAAADTRSQLPLPAARPANNKAAPSADATNYNDGHTQPNGAIRDFVKVNRIEIYWILRPRCFL